VYGAVRDHHWRTVPMTISALTLDARADGFTIGYTARHESLFEWRARIVGEADGTIHFAFGGEALTTFKRNRIGLCLLHPLRDCIGAPLRLRTGEETAWRDGPGFPDLVAREQPIAGFTNLTGLSHEIEPGAWAECTFEGERFETEDQRNWIDGSFKTYGTPLSLPMPVKIMAGTTIFQRITLRLRRDAPPRTATTVAASIPASIEMQPVRIDSDDGTLLPVTEIGVCLDERQPRLTTDEAARLRAMRLAHVRVDVRFGRESHGAGDAGSSVASGDEWLRRLSDALDTARAIGCRVELALHLLGTDAMAAGTADGSLESPLDRLFDTLTPGAIARLIVLTAGRSTTTSGILAAVLARRESRGAAWAAVPIATGSTQDLYRFHLDAPPIADAICWSMHPQAHANDVSSIAETPAAIADQVRSVKARHPGAAIGISPVLFSSEGVDPRLHTPFAAAWTLAALKHLIESGAGSATFFTASGPRGLMQDGVVFPNYHALKDVSALTAQSDARAIPTTSSDDAIASLLILGEATSPETASDAAPAVMFLANLSRHLRRVSLPAAFRLASRELPGDRADDALVAVPAFALRRLDGTLISSR
jgi:D-apionolactonase